MTRYTTRTEAIDREIIEPIAASAASAAEYDIDAIADEVLGDHAAGYACQVTPEQFGAVVAEHELTTYQVDITSEDQHHLSNDDGDLILDDQGQPQWFTTLSVQGYDGDEVAGEISLTVSDQWEPEVYRVALDAAGWTVLGEIPETFTPTLTVVRRLR